jgi:uncharacterized protein (DUF302 family)
VSAGSVCTGIDCCGVDAAALGGWMTAMPDNGMVHLSSAYSVAETVSRLEALLKARGVAVFGRIDHSGEAAKVGLQMRPAEVVIFGNPKAGTALMIAAPTAAIDLPLKALVWEDAEARVWLSYNSPEYLKQRHGIPEDLIANIAGPRVILEEAVR